MSRYIHKCIRMAISWACYRNGKFGLSYQSDQSTLVGLKAIDRHCFAYADSEDKGGHLMRFKSSLGILVISLVL